MPGVLQEVELGFRAQGGTALGQFGDGECIATSGQVVPLCLIVTELVTNALKYAHPAGVHGTIAVGCRKQADGTLVVEVADDGVGLPEDFDMAADGGLGARTIRVLARQLDAQFDFRSGPIGLRFFLRVPPPAGDRSDREAA